MTPKGTRCQRFTLASGDAVFVYSSETKLQLQLRREVRTEVDVASPSFKVAVELSAVDAQAIAGELLSAASAQLRRRPGATAGRGGEVFQ